ncbi:DEGS1 [Symbiodinium sp. CCMP2456]|nr:DEGS1 [Symbiodinium sp. CCMP2456]
MRLPVIPDAALDQQRKIEKMLAGAGGELRLGTVEQLLNTQLHKQALTGFAISPSADGDRLKDLVRLTAKQACHLLEGPSLQMAYLEDRYFALGDAVLQAGLDFDNEEKFRNTFEDFLAKREELRMAAQRNSFIPYVPRTRAAKRSRKDLPPMTQFEKNLLQDIQRVLKARHASQSWISLSELLEDPVIRRARCKLPRGLALWEWLSLRCGDRGGDGAEITMVNERSDMLLQMVTASGPADGLHMTLEERKQEVRPAEIAMKSNDLLVAYGPISHSCSETSPMEEVSLPRRFDPRCPMCNLIILYLFGIVLEGTEPDEVFARADGPQMVQLRPAAEVLGKEGAHGRASSAQETKESEKSKSDKLAAKAQLPCINLTAAAVTRHPTGVALISPGLEPIRARSRRDGGTGTSKWRGHGGSEEIAVATESATSPLLAPLKVASLGMGLLKPIFAAEAKLQALGYDEEEIRAKISEDVKSAPVVVYTYGLSPFCTEATKLLDSLGAQYKEIQLAPEWFLMLGESAAKRAELGAMYGRTSMPHIFIGGESVGGLMEGPGLVPLYESGELTAKLQAAGALPSEVVGATANHSLFLAIHELAHNLGASTIWGNKLISLVANLPIAIPYAINFKPYHMEHHRYQGQDGVDTDIPTRLEGWFLTDTSTCYLDRTCRKAVFMFLQIFFYALRPTFVKPSLVVGDVWMVVNYIVQFSFDGLMVYLFGPKVMIWFLGSSFLAGSIHPTAGHFIAEHYVMEGETETYSYYGPLNMLTYNVGYHNEHHDFPNVAWGNLPKVRDMAPEFYDNLPRCNSWLGTLLRYIFDDTISPYSRVKRDVKKKASTTYLRKIFGVKKDLADAEPAVWNIMHFSEERWLHLSWKFALNQTKRSCVKYRSCCADTSQAWTVADFWEEDGEGCSVRAARFGLRQRQGVWMCTDVGSHLSCLQNIDADRYAHNDIVMSFLDAETTQGLHRSPLGVLARVAVLTGDAYRQRQKARRFRKRYRIPDPERIAIKSNPDIQSIGNQPGPVLSGDCLPERRFKLGPAMKCQQQLPDRVPVTVEGWRRVQDQFFKGWPPLPDGWIRVISRSTGKVFFVDQHGGGVGQMELPQDIFGA